MIEGNLYSTGSGYYCVQGRDIHAGTPLQVMGFDGHWYDGRMEMRDARPGERVLPHCWGVWYVAGVGIAAQDLDGCVVRLA